MINVFPPPTGLPQWQGEPLDGRRLLVWPAEGFGDMIMMGRYLPVLSAQGASFTVGVHPKLARLFERIDVATHIVTKGGATPAFDTWCAFNRLPLLLGWPPPAEAVYLDFPLGSGGGVGVVPTGNPTYFNDAERSLFGSDAARLLTFGRDLRPEATGIYDFSDTADVIATLDLVVAVDSAVANLAASMGKETWVLVPATKPSYRWGLPGKVTWYPSVTQFRQTRAGDWASTLDEIELALRHRQS